MKSFWRKSGGFLAGFWRVFGESLAGFWRKLTERKRVSTEIRDGHALEAFRLLGRHALVTFRAVLGHLRSLSGFLWGWLASPAEVRSRFEGVSPLGAARFGHALEAFRLLGRHALVTFRAVLGHLRNLSVGFWGLVEAFRLLGRHASVTL